jgi:broad specificity phosphatase PhoE
MSTITFVRHAQATPFQETTDRLSSVGEQQAGMLGYFWEGQAIVFDEVYTGTLVRQQRTAELVGKRYNEAGLSWPKVQIIKELDEYDSSGILSKILPIAIERFPHIRSQVEAYRQAKDDFEYNIYFQRFFEPAMMLWIHGDAELTDVEPWEAFRNRVRYGIQRIISLPGKDRRVVAFTSGGPVAVAMQFSLGLSDHSALEVNWRIRNCSLTEFIFTKNRFSLDVFNATPHLTEPTLCTFR